MYSGEVCHYPAPRMQISFKLMLTCLLVHPTCSESQCSTGYSPFLTFEIEDMDKTIPQLIQQGAVLDGAIRYEAYGKVAAVRSPDGHMIGLVEAANLPGDGDTAVAAAIAAKRELDTEDSKT